MARTRPMIDITPPKGRTSRPRPGSAAGHAARPRGAHGSAHGANHGADARREAMQRLDWIANMMDSAVVIPGTRITVGLDALIGLAPGIGDAVTTLIALWLVKEARALGAPRHLIVRMVGNVAIDGLVGAVPLVGDAFDVMFRAIRRNMKLLRDHLARQDML